MKRNLLLFPILFFSFLVTQTLTAQVTQIWTDYNNSLWTSSSSSLNTTRPENSHNLLAFRFNGTNYSTGVNDAMLINGGVTFTPGTWQAFPISTVPTSGGSLYFVSLGQLYDGLNNAQTTGVFKPSDATTLASFLTDGRNGLNIGTGLANIPGGQTLRFNLSTNGIVLGSINDGVPDILFAQTAMPISGGDKLKFVNSSGGTVGSEVTFDLSNSTNFPTIANWMADFYNPDATIPTGYTNSERPIKLFAADLSVFGITSSNYQQAVALVYTTSGTSDPAFIAYNEPAINIPGLEVISQPSYYTSGAALSPSFEVALKDENGNIVIPSSPITITASLESGSGILSGTITATTNASGIATFSNLIITAASGGTHQIKFSEPNYNPAISSYLNCSVTPSGSPVTITLVESGGTTCGWSVNNGILTALADVSINTSEIETLLLDGDLTISAGQDIVINGNIDPALRGTTTLTLKAGRNIQLEGSRTIQPTLAALNLVFWADSDADQTGMVWIKDATTIQTNNGHFWMGGGSGSSTWNGLTVGDGYAVGGTAFIPADNTSNNQNGYHGITLDLNSTISTGSGNILYNGKSGAGYAPDLNSNPYSTNVGIYVGDGSQITTTSGQITMNGIAQLTANQPSSGCTTCGFRYGILLHRGGQQSLRQILITSTTGNIELNGTAQNYTGTTTDLMNSGGVTLFAGARGMVISSTSGSININGVNQETIAPTSRTARGIWFTTGQTDVTSVSGNITLNANLSIPNTEAMALQASTKVGDGTSGNITLISDGVIGFDISTTTLQGSGTLTIQPTSNSTTIGIAGASGTLQLPSTYFTSNFSDGFSNIIIGSDNHTGNINMNAVTLRDPLTLKTSGTLALGGIVDMGSNDLTLNPNTTVSASSTQYLKTSGTGLVKRTIANNASFTFPIGNSNYNPLTITNKNNLADEFNARVMDAVYANGSSGTTLSNPMVNVTWDIGKSNANLNGGVDFSFQWNNTQEVNGISSYRLNHFEVGRWVFAQGTPGSVSGSSIKTLSHIGYTGTFSPFAIGSSTETLPVTLIRFDARCITTGVMLSWSTASEQQNSHFIVERNKSGEGWKSIATVKGAGNSSTIKQYAYEDAYSGTALYRLRQVDLDGKETILPVATAKCGSSSVRIYPNPANTHFMIQGGKSGTQYRIVNQAGQQVEKDILTGSLHKVSLRNLPAGLYYVQFTGADGEQRKETMQVRR